MLLLWLDQNKSMRRKCKHQLWQLKSKKIHRKPRKNKSKNKNKNKNKRSNSNKIN
jgi:hypothetical protein